MANYTIPPDVLQPYLPKGCELDLFEGNAYVSLVGFMFKKTKLFKIPISLLGTFEEINLRFYVKRQDGTEMKRGVVFINETIPYKAVAWVANKLYKEHYMAIPTKNNTRNHETHKLIEYQWRVNKNWNSIAVKCSLDNTAIVQGSFEEFIFEHYYGYTKISDSRTEEYKVNHPRWNVNKVLTHAIKCDFTLGYGEAFSFLNNAVSHTVFMAEGSEIEIDWKRNGLIFDAIPVTK